MAEFWQICLVVCPMLFLAGLVDSVAGGGGLISMPTYLFVGIPVHIAVATNKVINSIGTGVATWKYFRSGKVEPKSAVWAAAGTLIGSPLGSRLALWCSDRVLQTCVLVALPVVAVVLLVKKDLGRTPCAGDRWSPRQRAALSSFIGLVIGVYDGMIGPGTGTFFIMAFTLVLGMDLLTASGCAKVANLASNVASAVVWIINGKVMWKLALPAAACCVLGNLCGARLAIKGGSKRVRSMIFVVLGLLFVKMGYELLF